ncbi:MAG: AraC family transcriptional regulator [bacterium]|nr:AraC family transcriptional regulator [bacterium]
MKENGNIQDLERGRLSLDIVKVVFRHCSPEWYMPWHRIEHANLTYVVSGEADYMLGQKLHHVSAGDLICVPHGDLRQASLVQENPMRCYSIDLYIRDASGTLLDLPLPYISHFSDGTVINDLLGRINVCWLQQTPYMHLQVRALLELLLCHVLYESRQPNHPASFTDDRITSMTTYIARHYARDLRLEGFAAQLGLNKVYLGALFKRRTGLSFHQYLTNARLNAAEDMLCTGKYTINEVAYLTGFQDSSYFSRVFLKMFGVRPGKYKRIEKPQEPERKEE